MAELTVNFAAPAVLQPQATFAIGQPLGGTFLEIAARVGTAPGIPDDHAFYTFQHSPDGRQVLLGDIVAVQEPMSRALIPIGAICALGRRTIRAAAIPF
jgi:hypothetical protein